MLGIDWDDKGLFGFVGDDKGLWAPYLKNCVHKLSCHYGTGIHR